MRDSRQEGIWRLYIDQIAKKPLLDIYDDIFTSYPDFSEEDIEKLKSDAEMYALIMIYPEGST